MDNSPKFVLARDAEKLPYTREVAAYCMPFSCQDQDLDDFFSKDAFFYDEELIGKTYAWVSAEDTYQMNGFKTLYKTEEEERDFLKLKPEEELETRFMFFDLKNK